VDAEPTEEMNVLVGKGNKMKISSSHSFLDQAFSDRKVVEEISFNQIRMLVDHVCIQIGFAQDHGDGVSNKEQHRSGVVADDAADRCKRAVFGRLRGLIRFADAANQIANTRARRKSQI